MILREMACFQRFDSGCKVLEYLPRVLPIGRRWTPDFRGHFVRAIERNSQETL